MVIYRERLWASPWTFAATALVIPACIVVFLPINVLVGVGVAVLIYAICVVLLVTSAPVIEVTATELRAGRAHLPRAFVGDVAVYTGGEAFLERGQRLDARAWLLIRGAVEAVVRISLSDPDDPTPYWLLSTRRPRALAAALDSQD